MYNKQAINLRRKESQQDKKISNRPTKYEMQKVNIMLYKSFKEYKIKDKNKINNRQIEQLPKLCNNQYSNFVWCSLCVLLVVKYFKLCCGFTIQ